jgi:gluconokinase
MFVSPYQKLGGLVWIPRMLGKIRLQIQGQLPADYLPYTGLGFDRRCVRFLGVDYGALVGRVAAGGTDGEILEWCFATGRRPTESEIHVWNEYMIKRGWRDTDASPHKLQAVGLRLRHLQISLHSPTCANLWTRFAAVVTIKFPAKN